MDTLACKEAVDKPACKEVEDTLACKQVCKALVLAYKEVVDKPVCMVRKQALVVLHRCLGNDSNTPSTSMQRQLA